MKVSWKDRFKSLFVPGHLRELLLTTDDISYNKGRQAGFTQGRKKADEEIDRMYAHLTATRDPYNEIAAKFVVADPLYEFKWQDPEINRRFGTGEFEPRLVNGEPVIFDGQVLVCKLRQPAYPRILETISKFLEGIRMMYCAQCLLGSHEECQEQASLDMLRQVTCECFKAGHREYWKKPVG